MRTPFREISVRLCPPDAAPVPQVEELRRDLRIKSQELEVKNAAANDKLKKMVKDQQEAEKKKVLAGRGGLVRVGFRLLGGGGAPSGARTVARVALGNTARTRS